MLRLCGKRERKSRVCSSDDRLQANERLRFESSRVSKTRMDHRSWMNSYFLLIASLWRPERKMTRYVRTDGTRNLGNLEPRFLELREGLRRNCKREVGQDLKRHEGAGFYCRSFRNKRMMKAELVPRILGLHGFIFALLVLWMPWKAIKCFLFHSASATKLGSVLILLFVTPYIRTEYIDERRASIIGMGSNDTLISSDSAESIYDK